MPTWNGEPFVADALQSVLAQGYGDFELLVLDDASTDGTLDVVSGLRDARIRIHRNRRRLGLAANWNRCLELAGGEYVKLFFQDDLLAPDGLERLVVSLAAGEGARVRLLRYFGGLLRSTGQDGAGNRSRARGARR